MTRRGDSLRVRGRRLPKSIGNRPVLVSEDRGDQVLLDRTGRPFFVPVTAGAELLPCGSVRISWRHGDAAQSVREIVTDFADARAALEELIVYCGAKQALDDRCRSELDRLCDAVKVGDRSHGAVRFEQFGITLFVERAPPRDRWQRLRHDYLIPQTSECTR